MAIVWRKDKPQLLDRVIDDIQTGLERNVPWLENIFPRAERLVTEQEGVRRYTPNHYKGRDEYERLLPCDGLGNFCFFTVDDPEQVTGGVGEAAMVTGTFSLIVWLDMRTVDDGDSRNMEKIEADILRLLDGEYRLRTGRMSVDKVYKRAENIFTGFTLDEVSNQYLMAPYAGFRFEGVMMVREMCGL